jgi:hypothetical protein
VCVGGGWGGGGGGGDVVVAKGYTCMLIHVRISVAHSCRYPYPPRPDNQAGSSSGGGGGSGVDLQHQQQQAAGPARLGFWDLLEYIGGWSRQMTQHVTQPASSFVTYHVVLCLVLAAWWEVVGGPAAFISP